LLIATPNRLSKIGMQTGDLCKVAEPVAVNVEKPARERMQRRQGRGDERIAAAACGKPLQRKMKPQVKQRVSIMTSSAQLLRNLDVSLALDDAGASGGKDGN